MQDTITSSENRKCPRNFVAGILEEAPVYQDPVTGGYIVSRSDDVCFVYDNPELFSAKTNLLAERTDSPAAMEGQRRFAEHGFPEVSTLTNLDAPEHMQYRGVVADEFSMSFVKASRGKITAIADELIDGFIARGHADLYQDFTVLLPMYFILDEFGLPRDDWKDVKRWSDAMMARIDAVFDRERELALIDEVIEMQNYVFRYIEEYRANPQDNLLSKFGAAQIDGRRLSDAEVVSISYSILVAGNETSTTAMTSALNILLSDDKLFEQLKEDPECIKKFVEEALRSRPPVPMIYRMTTQDVTVGDKVIPKNSLVQISNFGGNIDPRKWGNPDEIDLTRKGGRSHFAFGRGIHYCVGAALAREEMKIALERLIARIPTLRLSSKHNAPEYVSHPFVHCLDSLHVEFEPSSVGSKV